MFYITLLDQFHPGIYSSQVIDVCDYLNKKHHVKIRVVAFFSIRELIKTDARKKLKQLSPSAIVLPAFPGIKNYEWTAIMLFFLCLFTRQRVAICRNSFCAKMALRVKKFGLLNKVILDGRSALSAEIAEYDAFPVDFLRNTIKSVEKFSVNNSDFRMSVSQKLIDYWQTKYEYNGTNHVVIPCTLDGKYFNASAFKYNQQTDNLKFEIGIKSNDIVLVYSGSTAPWQSFELLEKIFSPLLKSNNRIKLLFLSKETEDNKRLQKEFPDRVIIKWLQHNEVLNYLSCSDYAILVREQSDTNKVASPTKFAEYLYAGLPVLISNNLGDFSDYVKINKCGYVLSEQTNNWSFLVNPSLTEKEHCFNLAINDFMKESEVNKSSYKRLVDFLNT